MFCIRWKPVGMTVGLSLRPAMFIKNPNVYYSRLRRARKHIVSLPKPRKSPNWWTQRMHTHIPHKVLFRTFSPRFFGLRPKSHFPHPSRYKLKNAGLFFYPRRASKRLPNEACVCADERFRGYWCHCHARSSTFVAFFFSSYRGEWGGGIAAELGFFEAATRERKINSGKNQFSPFFYSQPISKEAKALFFSSSLDPVSREKSLICPKETQFSLSPSDNPLAQSSFLKGTKR